MSRFSAIIFLVLFSMTSSICPPERSREENVFVDGVNVRVTKVVAGNCKSCSGSSNYSIESVISNKTSSRINLQYRYKEMARQTNGTFSTKQLTGGHIMSPKEIFTLACSCKENPDIWVEDVELIKEEIVN